MSAKQVIDELREWIALYKASAFYDKINDPLMVLFELKINELEQKYCKEKHQRVKNSAENKTSKYP